MILHPHLPPLLLLAGTGSRRGRLWPVEGSEALRDSASPGPGPESRGQRKSPLPRGRLPAAAPCSWTPPPHRRASRPCAPGWRWTRRSRPAGCGAAGGAGAAGGGRTGGTGCVVAGAGGAGSGCGGPARRMKMADRHRCRGGGCGTESLEGRPRKRNAGKTWGGCSGGGWVKSPEGHRPSPSVESPENTRHCHVSTISVTTITLSIYPLQHRVQPSVAVQRWST